MNDLRVQLKVIYIGSIIMSLWASGWELTGLQGEYIAVCRNYWGKTLRDSRDGFLKMWWFYKADWLFYFGWFDPHCPSYNIYCLFWYKDSLYWTMNCITHGWSKREAIKRKGRKFLKLFLWKTFDKMWYPCGEYLHREFILAHFNILGIFVIKSQCPSYCIKLSYQVRPSCPRYFRNNYHTLPHLR